MTQKTITRRKLIKGTAAAAAFTIIPRHAAPKGKDSKDKGAAPSDKVSMAYIGVGGRGGSVAQSIHGSGLCECVALCDVAMGSKHTGGLEKKFKDAPKFKDFRKMFDKMSDKIDACSVGVPDHAHFPIAMLAMSQGKHVYVEKPLAHTFQECALMIKAEEKFKVACQMGNQGHSGNNPLQFEAWVKAGIIKNVRKVDACMNKGRRWHPWKITGYPTGEKCPDYIDWDTWVGTAPYHEFSEKFHPGNWRGWYDYGNGAFGDWGPHTLDTIHRYLNLGMPEKVAATTMIGPNKYIYPMGSTIAFHFPDRGKDMPACIVNWYDGTKNKPPRPKELEEGRKMPGCGKVIYSDEFTFMGGTHSATLRFLPDKKMKEVADRLPKITKKHSSHSKNFVLSCLGKETTHSPFRVSGALTQVFMLGCIAQRLGTEDGKLELQFDREKNVITNNKVANDLLVGPPPRKGWEQFYKLV